MMTAARGRFRIGIDAEGTKVTFEVKAVGGGRHGTSLRWYAPKNKAGSRPVPQRPHAPLLRLHPDSRIARLPSPLRPPALVARWLRDAGRRPRYTFNSDGLATAHFSPFLEDTAFNRLYAEMSSDWGANAGVDARWRMWLLTSLARQCSHLPANFAEFGVYRGGCALMILATDSGPDSGRFYLFDTFSGIPTTALTSAERDSGFAGRLCDTSTDYVLDRLGRWRSQVVVCEGDVFDTLETAETGDLAFVHMDLNASTPTKHALEYAYPRLIAGAMIVFDDYGWANYAEQRREIDDFFSATPEDVLALPTGQGFVIKHGG